jgi:hypothetical protein
MMIAPRRALVVSAPADRLELALRFEVDTLDSTKPPDAANPDPDDGIESEPGAKVVVSPKQATTDATRAPSDSPPTTP